MPRGFLDLVEERVRAGDSWGVLCVMVKTLDSLGYSQGIDRGLPCLAQLAPKGADVHGPTR